MPPVRTIKNNAPRTAKGRAKITPAQLRIRPARAGTPCRLATRPCQIPKMPSISEIKVRSGAQTQLDSGIHSRLRAPKNNERLAAFCPSRRFEKPGETFFRVVAGCLKHQRRIANCHLYG